jgi:hypothetical protein
MKFVKNLKIKTEVKSGFRFGYVIKVCKINFEKTKKKLIIQK